MHAHKWSDNANPRGHRAFLHLHTHPDGPTLAELSLEASWASGAHHECAGIAAHFNGDSDLLLHAGIPHVANVFVTAGSPMLRTWLRKKHQVNIPDDRTIAQLAWHHDTLWWSLWTDYFGNDDRRLPRWRSGNWHAIDTIAGPWETIEKTQVVDRHGEVLPLPADNLGDQIIGVPMPEGVYRCRVRFERRVRRRPRPPWSWFPRVSYSYDIKVLDRPTPAGPKPDPDGREGYIPVPGKGENSWDCGGDGYFAMSGPGRTIAEAVGALVSAVYRDRIRHGGSTDYCEPIT